MSRHLSELTEPRLTKRAIRQTVTPEGLDHSELTLFTVLSGPIKNTFIALTISKTDNGDDYLMVTLTIIVMVLRILMIMIVIMVMMIKISYTHGCWQLKYHQPCICISAIEIYFTANLDMWQYQL